MNHKEHIIEVVNYITENIVPNYNATKVSDWNKVNNFFKSLGIPNKYSSQCSIEYEYYRTNVKGFNFTIACILDILSPAMK
jgi:hypothetical protein